MISKIFGMLVFVFIFIITITIGIVYNVLTWGFVLYKFWYWFMLPVFTNLPTITLIQSIGIFMFIEIFKTFNTEILNDKYKKKNVGEFGYLLYPILTLLTGWLFNIMFLFI